MNLYEPACCWNKMMSGKQFTIVFRVDEPRLSHKDPKVASAIITKLESIYTTTDTMIVHRGNIGQYLGVTLYF